MHHGANDTIYGHGKFVTSILYPHRNIEFNKHLRQYVVISPSVDKHLSPFYVRALEFLYSLWLDPGRIALFRVAFRAITDITALKSVYNKKIAEPVNGHAQLNKLPYIYLGLCSIIRIREHNLIVTDCLNGQVARPRLLGYLRLTSNPHKIRHKDTGI